ncbi:MAG: hypothetical protein ACREGA_03010 [Candidatus Saccharimonadales bacterium]
MSSKIAGETQNNQELWPAHKRHRLARVGSALALVSLAAACGSKFSPSETNPTTKPTQHLAKKPPEQTLKNNLCNFIPESRVAKLLGTTAAPPTPGVVNFGPQNCVKEQSQTAGSQGIYAKTPNGFFTNYTGSSSSGAVWNGNNLKGTLLVEDGPNAEPYTPQAILKPSSDPTNIGHYTAINSVAGHPAYRFVPGTKSGQPGAIEANNLPFEMVVIGLNNQHVNISVFNKIVYRGNAYNTGGRTQTAISTQQAINAEDTIASELIPADLHTAPPPTTSQTTY